MANFYLDNDVPVQLGPELHTRGHHTLHTRSQPGMRKAKDGHQLAFAVEHGLIAVTCNRRDFLLLHYAWRTWMGRWCGALPHFGILLLPHGVSDVTLAQAIDAHVGSAAFSPNELYELLPTLIWTHHPFPPP